MVFPDNFLWGVSSSGFQFEMGDPNQKSIDNNTDWFIWVHDKYNIERKIVSGDLPENGPNYWFLYKKDHEISSKLGLNAYRIGIEWSRIFPKSTKDLKVDIEKSDDGRISEIHCEESFMEKIEKIANNDALNHYRSIIIDLKERGIEPFVCLNHFTLPLWIHNPIIVRNSKLKEGPKGWVDEDTIIEFWKYAAYMAWKIGDLIDYWAIFNEPIVVVEGGYLFPETGFPPGLRNFNAFKKSLTNMIIAYARAYDAIKEWDNIKANENNPSQAEVGLIQNISPMYPYNPKIDKEACDFANHIHNTFFIEAISNGWLDENLNGIKDKGEIKGYLKNRLDWIGINYYSRNVIRKSRISFLIKIFTGIPIMPELIDGYGNNCKPNSISKDGRQTSDFGWEIYPEGLLDALKIISKFEKPIFITENGIADAEDKLRPQFIIEHLKILDKAINIDKINVKGYFHWALIDNYEWASGFKMKFGLYAIDHTTKSRIQRKSAEVFKNIIETKAFY